MLFLRDKRSLTSLSSDPIASSLINRFSSSVLHDYVSECRSLKTELAESAELAAIVKQEAIVPDCIVDVGCGHGLLSLGVASKLEVPRVCWVDRDESCRAARFANALDVKFCSCVEQVVLSDKATLILVVNLCSQSLLDVIEWYKRDAMHGSWMLCVPCCGPEGIDYPAWLNHVECELGIAQCLRIQLENNLKRVAIVHKK